MSTQAPPAAAASTDAAGRPAAAGGPDRRASAHRSDRSGRAAGIRFGIQSKLLIMLLATSILSALVVGFVGYTSGKDSLQNAAFNQLTQVRESRAREITSFFDQLTNSLVIYTRGATAIEAVQGFTAGFRGTANRARSPRRRTRRWTTTTATSSSRAWRATPETPRIRPASSRPTRRRNTCRPITPRRSPTSTRPSRSMTPATAAPGRRRMRNITTISGNWSSVSQFEDALLLDTNGNVVYSAYGGADLGTNVETGPYRDSNLADAYQDAMASNAVDFVELTDYGRYQPSYGVPTAWAVSPIGSDGVVSGVLALQLPITAINDVMTGGEDWEAEGLGDTGETYLAGADEQMRSVSRLVLRGPGRLTAARSIAAGEDPALADQGGQGQGHRAAAEQPTPTRCRTHCEGQTGTIIADGLPGPGGAGRLCAAADRGSALGDRRQDRRRRGLPAGHRFHQEHDPRHRGDDLPGLPGLADPGADLRPAGAQTRHRRAAGRGR